MFKMHAFPFGKYKVQTPQNEVPLLTFFTPLLTGYSMKCPWNTNLSSSVKVFEFMYPKKSDLIGTWNAQCPAWCSIPSNFIPLSSPLLHSLCTARVKAFLTHDILNYIQRHARQLHQSGAGPNVSSRWSKTYSSIFTPRNWRGEKKIFKGQSASF